MTLMLTNSPPSSDVCRPRWSTPRRPERPTLGGEAARIAKELGIVLMPWQSLVLDVGLELLPDGLPAYREVWTTVPRQQGKTVKLLIVQVHRGVVWRPQPQRIVYSAQTGSDGRKKLLDDYVPLLEASPLKLAVRRVYSAVGAEGVVFRTRSRIDVMASSEESGHGKTIDLGIIDEAFADVDDRREQAVKPAMMTKRDAQLWGASTAGHEGSAYLKRKVDAGRAAVTDGADNGIAYFEWSAEPGSDISSPEVWRSCMPALGYTVTEAVVQQALETMTPDEFSRSFLNMWTVAEERVIPAVTWNAVCGDDVVPDGGLILGIDVAVDRDAASIVVVDGEKRCELIEHRPGTSWLVDRVAELGERWNATVATDSRGPVAPMLPELEARGVRLVRYGATEMAAACAGLYDAIADRQLRIRAHPDLDAAAAGARRRVAGDAWYWARRDARVDISPLVALTVAYDLAVACARTGEVWAEWG